MGEIKIPTSFNIELEFEVAEFHRRLIAWSIDLFIQIFYLVIASKLYSQSSQGQNPYDSWAIGLMIMLPFFLYHLVSEITMNGQSIGKKLMRIRVVNENGGKASISQFIIRWLIRTSDYMVLMIIIYAPLYGTYLLYALFGSVVLLLADITLVGSTKKAQRIGDILAHTILIRTNPKGSMHDTVFIELAENYIPQYPQIMQLNDRDINSIKSILDVSRKRNDSELALMASEKIKGHLNIQSSLSSTEFLEVLLKDYNYLSAH
jgi:uncharacterized RDD family membrane protein YckC